MAKRLFDIALATLALLLSAPFVAVAALGILLSSPGPVFYRARRVGRGGSVFTMYKLRTMHVTQDGTSAITAPGDVRIFPFGNLIRRLKIDELPQFWNILNGDMSVVGPRPEAPEIVDKIYTDWMRETLRVRPGITSPGAIYNYLMAEVLLDDTDPEGTYARNLLPPKLALERAYLERATFFSDLVYIALTGWAIIAHVLRRDVRLPEVDITNAHRWAPQGPYPNERTSQRHG
ncbi:Sugar transferase involved in LPS biosynthesis (colanic, teichoic acid) [Meinhardsimonia xiamenensis]|jgi:lipopolysaccharide/colanic/teichoic acid biosynthesis glycosyltransferase|uniref:Sugar transferase involved in LPS biosynthesis (Colanic, teichoic acid) n=1 Tax=Meinhardsimonia xiamenensis TaxID=990712 RepID=A0A1G9HFE1_9RHOB|nr:sugar transferase [Meinhardsimonia xiamenensis]PRX28362.1 lipopolysaccharide/colanic/teichoic acid biosynthesis glycosyltransferase [Meinhardsimonia xiamenensis]SDL11424.1 Sugar transferase involved in LPS biosynthesis (colanic, teichoic acid) [Meinhardsimonia xiamenensis]